MKRAGLMTLAPAMFALVGCSDSEPPTLAAEEDYITITRTYDPSGDEIPDPPSLTLPCDENEDYCASMAIIQTMLDLDTVCDGTVGKEFDVKGTVRGQAIGFSVDEARCAVSHHDGMLSSLERVTPPMDDAHLHEDNHGESKSGHESQEQDKENHSHE